jgi:hypothetical protein
MTRRGLSTIFSAWVGLACVLTASTGAVSADTSAIDVLSASGVRDGCDK